MKKILKKKTKPVKKPAPKKAAPKPRKAKPSTPTPAPDEPEEDFNEDFSEPAPDPIEARIKAKDETPLSNFPEREMLLKFASGGKPKLIDAATLRMVQKCDPKHPYYDKLFAECIISQAKNESGATKTTVAEASLKARDTIERPYKIEMEGEYDPASYVQEGDTFTLFKQSAGFSLYASKGEPKVYRIVDAGTRYVTPHTKIEGVKTSFLPPPDQKEWDEI